jgi:predicted nucleic acid-binding protein
MAWAFVDETNAYADAVLASLATARAVVTVIWSLEVANALLVGERRGRITLPEIGDFIEEIVPLPIRVDHGAIERATGEILQLARAQNLTTYDSSYLDLALRLALPLATLDQPLRAAAVGVAVYAPP